MISKKSRKVVAALLIGATVCASGTFAYFNSKANWDNAVDTTTAGNVLSITNGKVAIKGQISGVTSTDKHIWSYDVARLSTIDSMKADTKFAGAIKAAYPAIDDSTTYEGILKLAGTSDPSVTNNYVNNNLSPDILGVGTVNTTLTDLNNAKDEVDRAKANLQQKIDENADSDTINAAKTALTQAQDGYDALLRDDRASVGDKVVNSVLLARPGDAFVLGDASKGEDNGGLEIVNESNLTTKIGLKPKGDNTADAGNADAIEQLKALEDAGWKLYIKVSRVDSRGQELASDGSVANDSTKATYSEVTSANFGAASGTVTTYLVSNVKPGENIKINLRVELPLDTKNNKQDKTLTKTATGVNTPFDVTQLFDVVATQENNPGWNEDGTSSTPVTPSPVNP